LFQSSDTQNDDIHSWFGLNVGIGELLQNWGLLNLSPFRRKSSKPSTPSPSNQSPQKQMQASKTNPTAEHIELVQLSNIKVQIRTVLMLSFSTSVRHTNFWARKTRNHFHCVSFSYIWSYSVTDP